MEELSALMHGFAVVLTPMNIARRGKLVARTGGFLVVGFVLVGLALSLVGFEPP